MAKEGARIIASDCNVKNVEETIKNIQQINNNTHISLELNVGSSNSVKNALTKIIEKYNEPPSIIVNCAGITRDNFLLKMSEADFDEVINVNLKVCINIEF